MVAMDQRESLRTMLRDHGLDAGDERFARFKEAVARELGPHASGFLIEPGELATVAPHVPHGLILAVDGLVQEEGGPVEDTYLVDPGELDPQVAALKLLVIWRDDDRRAERVELARRFVALAQERGVLSVLEPVVRVPRRRTRGRDRRGGTRARRLGAVALQVPGAARGRGTAGRDHPPCRARSTRSCRCRGSCSRRASRPTRSRGPSRLPAAAARPAASPAERSGLPRSATTTPPHSFARVSVPRLQELGRIVDEYGRSWRDRT